MEEVELTRSAIGIMVESEIRLLIEELRADLRILTIETQSEVRRMSAAGMTTAAIIDTLTDDLNITNAATGSRGGRVFGAAFAKMAASAEARILNLEQASRQHVLNQRVKNADGTETLAVEPRRWICELRSTCHSCLPRHNELRPMKYWVANGLPKSGFSVCKHNCKCVIISVEIAPDQTLINEPIRLAGKKARLRMGEIDEIAERGGPKTKRERDLMRFFGQSGRGDSAVNEMINAFGFK